MPVEWYRNWSKLINPCNHKKEGPHNGEGTVRTANKIYNRGRKSRAHHQGTYGSYRCHKQPPWKCKVHSLPAGATGYFTPEYFKVFSLFRLASVLANRPTSVILKTHPVAPFSSQWQHRAPRLQRGLLQWTRGSIGAIPSCKRGQAGVIHSHTKVRTGVSHSYRRGCTGVTFVKGPARWHHSQQHQPPKLY